MNVHKNARLTADSRAELVRRVLEGQPRKLVAEAFGVDPKTVTKWVNRYLADGPSGLADRSSRPHRLRKPIPDETRQQIIAFRKLRFTGQQIARETKVSPATVSRVLRHARLSRIKDLDAPKPVTRYQRENPGDMIHLDIKKLGRFENPVIALQEIEATKVQPEASAAVRSGAQAGSSSMSASMTHPESRSAKSCPMRKARVPCPSSKQPAPTMPASASPSRAS